MLAHQAASPGVIAILGNLKHLTEQRDRVLVAVLGNELECYTWLREKMPKASDKTSRENILTFDKNICTIVSGEAQWGRSRLEKIPQNPANALELDS